MSDKLRALVVDDEQAIDSVGAAGILRKPFTPQELREAVTAIMARKTDPEVIRRKYSEALAAAKKMYGLAREVDPEYLPAKRNLDRLVFLHQTRGSVELE